LNSPAKAQVFEKILTDSQFNPLPTWCDIVSINQEDSKDVTAQVSVMDEIYRNASLIIVVLNHPDMDTMKPAFEAIYLIGGKTVETSIEWNKVEALAKEGGLVPEYSSRYWTLQESVLAQDVKFLCSCGCSVLDPKEEVRKRSTNPLLPFNYNIYSNGGHTKEITFAEWCSEVRRRRSFLKHSTVVKAISTLDKTFGRIFTTLWNGTKPGTERQVARAVAAELARGKRGCSVLKDQFFATFRVLKLDDIDLRYEEPYEVTAKKFYNGMIKNGMMVPGDFLLNDASVGDSPTNVKLENTWEATWASFLSVPILCSQAKYITTSPESSDLPSLPAKSKPSNTTNGGNMNVKASPSNPAASKSNSQVQKPPPPSSSSNPTNTNTSTTPPTPISSFSFPTEISIPLTDLALTGIFQNLPTSTTCNQHNNNANLKQHKALHCTLNSFETVGPFQCMYRTLQQQQQQSDILLSQHLYILYVLDEACHFEVWIINGQVNKDTGCIATLGAGGRVILDKERKRIVSPVLVLHSEVKQVEENQVPKAVRRVKRGKTPVVLNIV
jgi:hypothetical protein